MISSTFDRRQWPALRLRAFILASGIASEREIAEAFIAFKTDADPEPFMRLAEIATEEGRQRYLRFAALARRAINHHYPEVRKVRDDSGRDR